MAVAKDLFDAYFFGKTVDDNGELVFPGQDDGDVSASSTPSQAG